MVKNPPANAAEVGLIPGLGRSPGEGYGNLLQYSCLKISHGQGRLAGYSPWGHKESDITEHPHKHTHREKDGPVVKNLPVIAGDTGLIPGLGISHMPWGN